MTSNPYHELMWATSMNTTTSNISQATKSAIIETIQQELWPLQGQFDELDEVMDEFERQIKAVELEEME